MKNDIRTNGKHIAMDHASRRGKVQRNANDFTRGSQLVIHELQMFGEGLKVPMYIVLGIFALAATIALSIWYSHAEFYLAAMRVYSGFWSLMDLDPNKPVDLHFLDGTIGHTTMEYASRVPAVKLAWNHLLNVLAGSFIFSILVGYPFSIWFIEFSKKRGNEILQDHHERGALLVTADTLAGSVRAYNEEASFEEWARDDPEERTRRVWDKLALRDRHRQGVHIPYKLCDIPYPYKTEMSHTMFIGSTGSGKTVQLLETVAQAKKRGEHAVIFDLTGQFVERFFDPATDHILNPFDERCPAWSIFNDCENYVHFASAAAALVPSDGGHSEPFWVQAARTIFVEMCVKLQAEGRTTNRDIAQRLMTADLESVHASLQETVASPLTSPEAARMAESIRSTFNTHAQVLRFLRDDGPQFSITDWLHNAPRGSMLFITSTYTDLAMTRQLLTLWLDIAVQRLLDMPRIRQLRSWFIFDEIHALHRLPAIENGLQTARGYGGAFVLGLHSFDKLCETYGERSANTLAALARNKLILTTADSTTAQACSGFIGDREVRQMDEGYSYGISKMRDGSTVTPTTKVEPLVIPADLMNLPSLTGYVKFSEGFPAARVAYKFKDWPVRNPGFMRKREIVPVDSAFSTDFVKSVLAKAAQDGSATEGGIASAPQVVVGVPQDAPEFDSSDYLQEESFEREEDEQKQQSDRSARDLSQDRRLDTRGMDDRHGPRAPNGPDIADDPNAWYDAYLDKYRTDTPDPAQQSLDFSRDDDGMEM